VVLGESGVKQVDAIRAFIKDKLPEYMLPSLLIEIDDLPMTSTGKLAVHLLPKPDFNYLPVQTVVAPKSETEQVIHSIWKSVLQLETISINSNFFELGGHSLKATQVVSRIRDELELSLPLRIIFSKPSISEIAAYIDAELKNGETSDLVVDKITAASEDLGEIDLDELNDEEVELLLSELSDESEVR